MAAQPTIRIVRRAGKNLHASTTKICTPATSTNHHAHTSKKVRILLSRIKLCRTGWKTAGIFQNLNWCKIHHCFSPEKQFFQIIFENRVTRYFLEDWNMPGTFLLAQLTCTSVLRAIDTQAWCFYRKEMAQLGLSAFARAVRLLRYANWCGGHIKGATTDFLVWQ